MQVVVPGPSRRHEPGMADRRAPSRGRAGCRATVPGPTGSPPRPRTPVARCLSPLATSQSRTISSPLPSTPAAVQRLQLAANIVVGDVCGPTVRRTHRGVKGLERIGEPLRPGVGRVRQRPLLERLRRVLVTRNGTFRVSRGLAGNRILRPTRPTLDGFSPRSRNFDQCRASRATALFVNLRRVPENGGGRPGCRGRRGPARADHARLRASLHEAHLESSHRRVGKLLGGGAAVTALLDRLLPASALLVEQRLPPTCECPRLGKSPRQESQTGATDARASLRVGQYADQPAYKTRPRKRRTRQRR